MNSDLTNSLPFPTEHSGHLARTGQGGNLEMTETLLVLESNPKEKLGFLFIFMAFWWGERKLDIYVNFWRTILSNE